MLELNPRFGDVVEAELRSRNLYPELIQIVLQGLRDAGLDVPDHPRQATGL